MIYGFPISIYFLAYLNMQRDAKLKTWTYKPVIVSSQWASHCLKGNVCKPCNCKVIDVNQTTQFSERLEFVDLIRPPNKDSYFPVAHLAVFYVSSSLTSPNKQLQAGKILILVHGLPKVIPPCVYLHLIVQIVYSDCWKKRRAICIIHLLRSGDIPCFLLCDSEFWLKMLYADRTFGG